MVKYISLVTFPLMCGLFVLAPEFIKVCYGEKWLAAIPLVQVMCFCGMLQSIYSSTTSIFLSQGKSRQIFMISIFNCLVVAISVLAGLPWGIMGVAVSYTIGQIGWVILVQGLSNRVISLDFNVFLAPLMKNIIFSFLLLIAMASLKMLIKTVEPLFVLVGTGTLGVGLYVVFIFVFERAIFNSAIQRVYGVKNEIL
jgi:O-antigen/teichoic acid export membrane protein